MRGPARPWLLAATANLAWNSHRPRLRREALLRTPTREPDDGEPDALERIDDQGIREDLVKALQTSTPQDVAAVAMTALDGDRGGEVAGLLGLMESDARVRRHRAHPCPRVLLTPAVSPADPREVTP